MADVGGLINLLGLCDGPGRASEANGFVSGMLFEGYNLLGIYDPDDVGPVMVDPLLSEHISDGCNELVGNQA